MKISAAETRVLEALWRAGPLDAVEATAALAETEGWGEPTVRTLLTRLVAKKAVARAKEGRRSVYRALLQQADYAAGQSETLVDRYFGGRISPLVLQFAERRRLTAVLPRAATGRSHQAGTPACTRPQVASSATSTVAATVQSSPMTKSIQKSTNPPSQVNRTTDTAVRSSPAERFAQPCCAIALNGTV